MGQINKRILKNKETNSHYIMKFEDSLENLKNFPLHKAFVTDTAKTLADIYYDQKEMLFWKNRCLKKEENIEARFDKIKQYQKKLKNKMKAEMKGRVQGFRDHRSEVIAEYHAWMKEKEEEMLSQFQDAYDEYKQLRKHMEVSISIDSHNHEAKETALFYLSTLDRLQKKMV